MQGKAQPAERIERIAVRMFIMTKMAAESWTLSASIVRLVGNQGRLPL
jgi:hypothetical protein